MLSIKKKLRLARPKLKMVSPLVNKIIIGFIMVNIAIAIQFSLLSNGSSNTKLAVVNSVFTYRFWGCVYALLALFLWWSLVRNNWNMLKKVLTAGLFVKSIWFYALVIICIDRPSNIGITTLWFVMAWVQFWSVIHFSPNVIDSKGSENDGQ